MELIYTCISKLVICLEKNSPDKVTKNLNHYADLNDYNKIFYHQRNDDMEQIIQKLLNDSDSLLAICGSKYEDLTEYQLFTRCLSDQTVGKNDSVVTDYQYDKNTHTDSQFLKESMAEMEKFEEAVTLIIDGGYDGQDNIALAKEKTVSKFITSKNASNRAKSQRYIKSDEFSNYAKLRNGVETVPSNIRKNYYLEKLPRGKQRGKFFFGSKVAALNFRKLFGFRKGLSNYALNPVLSQNQQKNALILPAMRS